jgi:Glucose / Sorbosone dehydrogenase
VTGLSSFDWLLVLLYVFAVILIAKSIIKRGKGWRIFGIQIIPVVSGLAVIFYLALRYHDETRHSLAAIPTHKWAILISLATVVTGVAVFEFLLAEVSRAQAWLQRPGARLPTGTANVLPTLAVAACGILALLLLGRLHETNSAHAESGQARIQQSWALGQITDIASRSKREGYAALENGTIVHFIVPPTGGTQLRLNRVAHGLLHPRGLAILGHTLFVSELGRLPCDPNPCPGYGNEGGAATERGDERYLKNARGRVIAFTIHKNGTLGSQRLVLSGLPVANTLHGVNGITAGADGLLYMSIGNLDALYRHPGIAKGLTPKPMLLGTIVRFEPDGSRLEIVARGLRNVYGLTFDKNGNLWGVDNDGPTLHGWRAEELLLIRRGGDYGYPYDASFGPYTRRTVGPVWILSDVAGSAAIESAPRLGLGPGIVDGSCGAITYVDLPLSNPRDTLAFRPNITTLLDLPGCVTAVKPGPNHTMLASLFPWDKKSPSLYVISVNE